MSWITKQAFFILIIQIYCKESALLRLIEAKDVLQDNMFIHRKCCSCTDVSLIHAQQQNVKLLDKKPRYSWFTWVKNTWTFMKGSSPPKSLLATVTPWRRRAFAVYKSFYTEAFHYHVPLNDNKETVLEWSRLWLSAWSWHDVLCKRPR